MDIGLAISGDDYSYAANVVSCIPDPQKVLTFL